MVAEVWVSTGDGTRGPAVAVCPRTSSPKADEAEDVVEEASAHEVGADEVVEDEAAEDEAAAAADDKASYTRNEYRTHRYAHYIPNHLS